MEYFILVLAHHMHLAVVVIMFKCLLYKQIQLHFLESELNCCILILIQSIFHWLSVTRRHWDDQDAWWCVWTLIPYLIMLVMQKSIMHSINLLIVLLFNSNHSLYIKLCNRLSLFVSQSTNEGRLVCGFGQLSQANNCKQKLSCVYITSSHS